MFLPLQLLPVNCDAAGDVELRYRVAAASLLARRALRPAAARRLRLRLRPQDGPTGSRVQGVQTRPGVHRHIFKFLVLYASELSMDDDAKISHIAL